MVNLGDSNRRDLFRGAFGEWFEGLLKSAEDRVVARHYFRPPGALSEVGFLAACTRCGDCITVCPVHAIVRVPADGGFAAGTPYLDPTYQPCIVCADMPCARACPTEALNVPEHGWQGYHMALLELDPERCVTFAGTECGLCAKACPVGEAALALDQDGRPVLKAEGCVGCGVCVRTCITHPSSLKLTQLNDR
ncbi:MAG TPA: 4Fe-4S dicluster domain-containing protein [Gemmatimonadales bacterium]|nr:4Fe-4S dicluster domain-containing protein [Gemmatimonadales bacterium]